MPTASAPNAPWVDVWLSPQTIVIPGCVRPCSGPITCTMPWPGSPIAYSRMPNSSQFWASTCICLAEIGSRTGRWMSVVGTLWSIVATVRSGRRTVRPASRRPSNACGDVTSWTGGGRHRGGRGRRRHGGRGGGPRPSRRASVPCTRFCQPGTNGARNKAGAISSGDGRRVRRRDRDPPGQPQQVRVRPRACT